MAEVALRYVDRVYAVGYPDQSRTLALPRVENAVTRDNGEILARLSHCPLVLSHNSGAAFVPMLLGIPAIVFHSGELKNFLWTRHCAKPWSEWAEDCLERAADLTELDARLRSRLAPALK